MRTLFIILFILWTLFSWDYYLCKVKHTCWRSTPSATNTSPNSKPIKPLKFRWSSHQIPLDSGFPALRKAIIAQKGEGQVLQITGHYFLSENKGEATDDLGMARAKEVKKMLLKDFSEDQIKTFTSLLPLKDIPKDSLVEAIRFEWVDATSEEANLPKETAETEQSSTSPVIEEDRAGSETSEEDITSSSGSDYFVKHFPYNQTRMPAELSTFLDDLAARIIAEDKKVVIRGHTDSAGDKELNFKVGLRRAKKIRDQLINRGVARRNIETTSDGEDTPVASNETEEGRQQNRRIEIILK